MSYLEEGYDENMMRSVGEDSALLLSETSEEPVSTDLNASTPLQVMSGLPSGSVDFSQTALRTVSENDSMQSSNFITGSEGWKIDGDGNAEFQDGTFRGSVTATSGTFEGITSADINVGDGAIRGGKTGYTDDVNGGFFIGYHGTAYKAYIGAADDDQYIKYDGTNLSIVGGITATTGTIGGWTIGTTSLTAGSGANTVGLDSGGTNPALYAGSATPGSAPFRVTKAGALTATSATITGAITATSGTFAGITAASIDVGAAGYVKGGKTAYTDTTNAGFFLGVDSGAYKLYAGAASDAAYLKYDGTNLSLYGGTITGGTIQTATGTGTRLVLSGANNKLSLYSSSNVEVMKLTTDGLYFSSDGTTFPTSLTGYADGGSTLIRVLGNGFQVLSDYMLALCNTKIHLQSPLKVQMALEDEDEEITYVSCRNVSGFERVQFGTATKSTFTGDFPFVPTGGIIPYGGSTAPTGWLLCDGAAVSRSTYADLFAIIGTTFGAGNGSTTFNLPNLTGKFPQGVDGTYTRGSTGGAATHTHGNTDSAHEPDTYASVASGSYRDVSTTGHYHVTGNGSSFSPYLAVNYIIKD